MRNYCRGSRRKESNIHIRKRQRGNTVAEVTVFRARLAYCRSAAFLWFNNNERVVRVCGRVADAKHFARTAAPVSTRERLIDGAHIVRADAQTSQDRAIQSANRVSGMERQAAQSRDSKNGPQPWMDGGRVRASPPVRCKKY